MLGRLMILTHAALPQASVFFWTSLSFLGVASSRILSLARAPRSNTALSDTTLELRWLQDLSCDMDVSVVTPIPMQYHNKSVIAIASNLVFHDRTKHIEIDCHITRQKYEKDKITLLYVFAGAQLADLFTKAHISQQFRENLSNLWVFDPS